MIIKNKYIYIATAVISIIITASAAWMYLTTHDPSITTYTECEYNIKGECDRDKIYKNIHTKAECELHRGQPVYADPGIYVACGAR